MYNVFNYPTGDIMAIQKKQKEPKLLLGSLFVDAKAAVEPEEPAKIVVAGMVEATPVREYPEGFFKKAWAVLRADLGKLLKGSLYFSAVTVPFIIVLVLVSGMLRQEILGNTFNFMANIGIGYPGGGDSIAQSVASLYWDVQQPLLMCLAAAAILATPFIAGLFYAAKRAYYQNFYRRLTRTFFMGVAKYWWKFFIVGTIGILVMLAMGTSLLYLLAQMELGTAGAGAWCAVIFSFIIGAPLLTVPMVMMSLFTTYPMSLKDTFKDAIVIIVNNPMIVLITGVVSLVPLLALIISNIIGIIVFAVAVVAGYNLWALCWVALGERGMAYCKYVKAKEEKKLPNQRGQKPVYAKAEPATGGAKPVQKKKPAQQQHYQNPKKKKKK